MPEETIDPILAALLRKQQQSCASLHPQANKTAIILMGGGMRSAHGAGFLYALGTKLSLTSPHILVGSSGNAGNMLYFIAGQYDFLRRVWSGILSTPKFISFLRFYRIMDIDYLIDTVFKKILPLNIAAAQASSTEYFIPITDAKTGKTRYVGKDDSTDTFEVLRAAKAIPIIFGKEISLQGKKYIDGEMGPTLSDHVEFALSKGAKNIIVVDNTSAWRGITKLGMEVYALTLSKNLRNAIVRDINQHSLCVASNG
ncbi:hypothetical protein H7X87_03465, partial [Acetobacteraceae bacterium]|nr:hypothetical protein [Candidatus Parcubacteria bacterium]